MLSGIINLDQFSYFSQFFIGHRFVHYPTLNRYNSLQKKHYVKSGMTTHMSSDVDSVHSFKPHMKIEMEEDQLQLAPREVRMYSIH